MMVSVRFGSVTGSVTVGRYDSPGLETVDTLEAGRLRRPPKPIWSAICSAPSGAGDDGVLCVGVVSDDECDMLDVCDASTNPPPLRRCTRNDDGGGANSGVTELAVPESEGLGGAGGCPLR